MRVWLIYFAIIFFCIACETKVDSTKTLIVKVAGEMLYYEDFQEMIPPNSSPSDSAEIVNHHIDKWIKEALFINQARKKIDEKEIDALVQDYRNSLLAHNYESYLIENNLDTLISDIEIDNYYETNRSDFILAEPAYLMYMILIPYKEKSEFVDNWKADNWEEIEEKCKSKRYWHHLSDSLWVTNKGLEAFLPNNIASEVTFKKGFYKSSKRDSMYYMIEVKDRLKPGNEAPRTVVQKQIEKLILHKRTRSLLESEKAKLYEDAISKSTVVTYSDK